MIYELHVKGFSQLHPLVPEQLRGTYAGLASEQAIDHLKKLGISTVELMPMHHHLDDRYLVDKGLSNYWGYNTLAFFAPHGHYASCRLRIDAVREFKSAWYTACTAPESKLFWTWFTITRPKETIWGP